MKSEVTFGKLKKTRSGKPVLTPNSDAQQLSPRKPVDARTEPVQDTPSPVTRPKVHLPPKKRMAPPKPMAAPVKKEESAILPALFPLAAKPETVVEPEPGSIELMEQDIEHDIVASATESPRDMFDERPALNTEEDDDETEDYEAAKSRPWDLKFALALIALVVAINIALTVFLSGDGKQSAASVAEQEPRKLRPVTRVTSLPPPVLEAPKTQPAEVKLAVPPPLPVVTEIPPPPRPVMSSPATAKAEAPLNLPPPAAREVPVFKPSVASARKVPAIEPEQLESLEPAAGVSVPPPPLSGARPASVPPVAVAPAPAHTLATDDLLQILNQQ